MSEPSSSTQKENNESTFRRRVVRASVWSMGGYATSQALRLISNLVMTRLLAPEMFGIMAVVYMIQTGFVMFSDIGIKQNVIQHRLGDTEDFKNTAWSIQVLRGLLLWLLALLLSAGLGVVAQLGWFAPDSVYSDPMLPIIMSVTSVSLFILGFESMNAATAYRSLAPHRVVMSELFTQISGFAIMLTWAAFDRSVWAIAVGGIATSIIKVVLSHIVLPGKLSRWKLDRTMVRELLNFGKWVFPSSILGFLLENSDRLLLGGLVSSDILGLYAIAYLMLGAMQGAIQSFVYNVGYPALSQTYREDATRLRATYYRLRLPLDVGALVIAGFLWAAGPTVVSILYDGRYADSGKMLQLLSLILVAHRFTLTTYCYLAVGRPKLLPARIVLQLVTTFVLLPLGFQMYGVMGALGGMVCSNLGAIVFDLVFGARMGVLDVKREIVVLPLFGVGLIVGHLFSMMF